MQELLQGSLLGDVELVPLLSEREAAQFLAEQCHFPRAPKTLRKDRSQGRGAPFCRVGSRVGYRPETLRQWAASQRTTEIACASELPRHAGARATSPNIAA